MKSKRLSKAVRYSVLNEELDSLPIREAYPRLIEKLQVDVKRLGDAELRRLIFEVSEDKRVAGYILAVARDDFRRAEDRFEAFFGEWVLRARKEIARLKKEKEWEGGVNREDVHSYIARYIPEWREEKDRLRKAERIYRAADALYEAYKDRGNYLQTFARLREKRVSVELTKKEPKE